MDYCKALAILLVVVNHSMSDFAKSSPVFFFLIRMAVPIFVLVTGCTYTASMERAPTLKSWYGFATMKKKLTTYLLPMVGVFLVYTLCQSVTGHLDVYTLAKSFVLQSYGQGAYYFYIIVQLYLLFPLVYFVTRRVKGGYLIVILINVLYEIVLYWLPISISVYRLIGLRYVALLAMGSLVYEHRSLPPEKRNAKHLAPPAVAFLLGCLYLVLFIPNRDNAGIFRYTSWGNTNVLVCLYIVPLFYAVMLFLKNAQIPIKRLHIVVSQIGKSSYYIMCTQMMMFWYIERVWNALPLPLVVVILCNLIVSVSSGIGLHWMVEKIKTMRFGRASS